MNREDARWYLPGPVRAVEALCDTLYHARALTVRAPVAAGGFARAVERRLHEDGQVQVSSVTLQPGGAALPQIAASVGLPSGSAAAIVNAPMLADHAVLIGGATIPDSGLDDLMRLAARRAGAASPLVMVIGDGNVPAFGGLRMEELRAVNSPLDGAAHLAEAPPTWTGFEQRLGIAVACEVAAWDIDLLERLSALGMAEAVRPDLCVAAWGDDRLTGWAGKPPSWNGGSLDEWGGEVTPHAIWLAANRPDLLAKQVWRGQVTAMLPFIETRRLELIACFRGVLRPDLDRSGPDLEALDWGPLQVQLARQARWLVDMARSFRDARNELAHGRLLTWPQISVCLAAARRWASGAGAPTIVR